MTLLESAVLLILGYIAVFGLVNRICNCIEVCHGARNKKQEEQNG